MHRKKDYDGHEIVTIYQFMSMCGLECEKKIGCPLSHKAMLRKLRYRSHEFPLEVEVPRSVSFDMLSKENVKTGSIILVVDDYDKISPYKKPYSLSMPIFHKTEEQQQEIRDKILTEISQEEEKEEELSLKPGEIKYLVKQGKRLQQEEEKFLERMIEEEKNALEEVVTEKPHRLVKTTKRHYY